MVGAASVSVSVAGVRFPRGIVIVATAPLGTLWALVGAAPLALGWHRFAGFARRRRARPSARRVGRWRLFGPPCGARPTGSLGDRLDDFGLRRSSVAGSRRGGALGRPGC